MSESAGAGSPPTRARGAKVLFAERARLVAGSTTLVASLSATARGDRVMLVGDTQAMMAALMGTAIAAAGDDVVVVNAGVLRVLGTDVATGAHRAIAGMAPRDRPAPPEWTAGELVSWHARLRGTAKKSSGSVARAAFGTLELAELIDRRLTTLSAFERRALGLVAALAAAPPLLIIEHPFDGLDEPPQPDSPRF